MGRNLLASAPLATTLTLMAATRLDQEIQELESSLQSVNSRIKESSLRKLEKQKSDKIQRLRRELFVAEQQLQKSEEEGELNPRKLMTHSQFQKQKSDSACLNWLVDKDVEHKQ